MRYHRLIWPVQKANGEIQLANLCVKLDNGLDYLQVFRASEEPDLWLLEDGPGGAINALLPSDY